MKLKVCVAHQMAILDSENEEKWRSFWYIFEQLLHRQIPTLELVYGLECPYCHRLRILARR